MPRNALTTLAVLGGVFALQSLPTAAAAKGGASGTSSNPIAVAEAVLAPHPRRAEREASREASSAVLPAAAVVSSPLPAEAPAAPARSHPRREARRSQTPSSAAASGPSTAVADLETSVADDAQALAQRQKKGSGGIGKKERKEKAKEKTKEKTKAKGKETGAGGSTGGQETEDPAGEGGSETASLKGKAAAVDSAAAPQALAVVSTDAASVTQAAPAGGTGSASITSLSLSKGTSGAGLDASRASRRARHAARKPVATNAGVVPVLAGASSLPSAARDAGAAASPRHKLARGAHKSSGQPALVKTFTKIVGVVPTPVRILIVVLIGLALLLGARSLFSGVRTRRLLRQRGQLLEDVGVLQAALLPVPPARLGPVETSVSYRPADGPGAGGDFYDVFALEDGQLAVIVGDVSGHGREALPHTALLRFTVRAYLEAGLSPRKALQTAGSVLERQLGGSFATVVAATYHPRERKLTYASAGHPPPVMLAEDAEAGRDALSPVTSCSAPPVGAGMRTGTRQTVVSIPGPARLCFHTDGVTEARIAGDLFGVERLAAALSDLQADADAGALLQRVAEQTDSRPDDMAACLLRVLDGEGRPSIVLEQLELDRELLAGPRLGRFLGDCGVPRAEAEAILREARSRLQRADAVLLELAPGEGRPIVSFGEDNLIHTVALATAGAS
ncbi:MAG TPA: PP2C family protein-serine/threonine phosphatase [Solirubrobacteraceae bacterium]|jgi:hypothetical protein|nr:PP2C family protein-serine/threonine phosphatase [Solirubrobacteraceae bacterium]